MFLISKIVRGRRLLHELEAEAARREAAEEAAAAAAQNAGTSAKMSTSQTPRRQRGSKVSSAGLSTPSTSRAEPGTSQAGSSPGSGNRPARRATTVRQKTETSLPEEDDVQPISDVVRPSMQLRRTSSMPSVNDVIKSGGLYNYDTKLNKLQKRSLRFTWQRLQTRNGGKKVECVFEDVFERMLRHHPRLRDMFTTRTFLSAMSRNSVASPRDHARITVRMIDNVIKSFDTGAKRRTEINELEPRNIGRAHAKLRPYGFVGNYWEKLGETIIDVVLAQEAVRDLPGAGQAWVVFTACLVDQLRVGFEENRNNPDEIFDRQNSPADATLNNGDFPETLFDDEREYSPESLQLDPPSEMTMNPPIPQCPFAADAWGPSRNETNPARRRHESVGRTLRRLSSKDVPQQCRSLRPSSSNPVTGDNNEVQDCDSYL